MAWALGQEIEDLETLWMGQGLADTGELTVGAFLEYAVVFQSSASIKG